MPIFLGTIQSPGTWQLSHSSGTKQGNASKEKGHNGLFGKFGSCAIRKAELVPIESDMHTPDDPDYESSLAVSEGLETAPEDNMDTESDIQAIKASMNIFYQVYHPHLWSKHPLMAERTKVSSLLPLNS